MRRFLFLFLALAVLALPLAAQVTATVSTLNDAGFKLVPANGPAVHKYFPANHTFSKYEYQYYYQRQPSYTYLRTYVSGPYSYGTYSFNRVYVSSYAYARKGSGHKAMGTTKDTSGNWGEQLYKVALSGNGTVVLDLRAYLYIYDNASARVELWDGNTRLYGKSANAKGYSYEYKKINLTVSGNKNLTVKVYGHCVPGQGSGYADGYYTSLYFYILPRGGAQWTLKGGGCSGSANPALGPPNNNNVTKGTYFDVTLSGAPANAPALALWGTSDTLFYFLKLPLDLGYMGATGCKLNVGFRWPYSRQADGNGKASFRFYVSKYYSGTYYFQWVVFDPAYPGGLKTTHYGQLKF